MSGAWRRHRQQHSRYFQYLLAGGQLSHVDRLGTDRAGLLRKAPLRLCAIGLRNGCGRGCRNAPHAPMGQPQSSSQCPSCCVVLCPPLIAVCCSLFKSLVPLWCRQIPYTMMKFGESLLGQSLLLRRSVVKEELSAYFFWEQQQSMEK